MKKLISEFRIWYYRRMFKKLLLFYMNKHQYFGQAVSDALAAFEWFADFKYVELYRHIEGDYA